MRLLDLNPIMDDSVVDDLCYIGKFLLPDTCVEIRSGGAEAVVLGCTAMMGVAERVRANLLNEGYDVPVIEAAQAALTLLETYVRMGVKQSRIAYPGVAR